MRTKLILVLMLFSGSSLLAAGTLKGIVLANELGGSPLSRVKVAALGANLTETGASGDFILQFPHADPGDTVQITIDKPGYVVVNYIQLRVVLAKNPDAEHLTVLLCREGEREQWASLFYRLKSVKSIEETYRRRVRELEENQQHTDAAMAALRKERDQAKAAAERAAVEFAHLDPNQITDPYREAMGFFLKGNVQEALNILNEDTLKRSAEEARRSKADAENQLNQTVQAYLLRARFLIIQFQFDEARHAFEKAIQISPQNAEAHFSLADLDHSLDRPDEARSEYLLALSIARREGNKYGNAIALDALGVLEVEQNRSLEALAFFEQALVVCRELAKIDPNAYASLLIGTLNNLGLAEVDQGRLSEARGHYGDALLVCGEQPDQSSENGQANLAMTFTNLGVLSEKEHRPRDGQKFLQFALSMYDGLQQKYPDKYSPDFALALNNIGQSEDETGEHRNAHEHFEKALRIEHELEQQKPGGYQREVAETLVRLGTSESQQGSSEQGIGHLEEALRIYTALKDRNRDKYLGGMAKTLNNLGFAQQTVKKYVEARQNYEEALKLFNEITKLNKRTYAPDMAQTLVNLGKLDIAENRTNEARDHIQDALNIYGETEEMLYAYTDERDEAIFLLSGLNRKPQDAKAD